MSIQTFGTKNIKNDRRLPIKNKITFRLHNLFQIISGKKTVTLHNQYITVVFTNYKTHQIFAKINYTLFCRIDVIIFLDFSFTLQLYNNHNNNLFILLFHIFVCTLWYVHNYTCTLHYNSLHHSNTIKYSYLISTT